MGAMKPLRVHILLLSALVLAACMLRGNGAETGFPPRRAAPMPAWDAAFPDADHRWMGADSVSSVPLSEARTLWLFGDTWIQGASGGGRESGRVIRNSIAVQETAGHKPGRIRYSWQETSGEPGARFVAASGPGWLWPLSGIRLNGTLYLFFVRVIPVPTGLGFEIGGSILIVVSNPRDPPDRWRSTQHAVPCFRHSPRGDLFFGVACLADKEHVYIYGIRENWDRGREGRDLLLARTRVEGLRRTDFSDWEFFSGSGWGKDLDRAAALFDGAATEMSVSYLPLLKAFVAVYTHCGLSPRVLARKAPRPEGPWGSPLDLWSCPETAWNERYFCYAGKAHPELATHRNEMVISYACNSSDLDDLVREPRLYWPRFVRIVFDGDLDLLKEK